MSQTLVEAHGIVEQAIGTSDAETLDPVLHNFQSTPRSTRPRRGRVDRESWMIPNEYMVVITIFFGMRSE